MRILLAGPNYRPETTGVAPFTTGLAEHLADVGHHVIVSTSFSFYPSWRWSEQPPRWRTREQLNGVDVWRTKVILPSRQTVLRRITFDTSVALTLALSSLSIPRVDITICVCPPIQTTLVGAGMRHRLGKVVALVHDLPTQAALSVGMLEEGAMLRIGRAFERAAYNVADHVVIISPAFAGHLEGLGVDATRITEIPNWADVDAIRPTNADPRMRNRLGARNGDFLVVHSGNMGAKQDLDNVVGAARILRNSRRIKFAIIGDGMDRARIEKNIERERLENIKVLPLQPSNEFAAVLGAANALLINQAPMVVDSVLPSKLLTYMAAGRPVVAAVHAQSTTADLVRRAACGVLAVPGKPEALADAIESLAAREEGGDLSAMGLGGRQYVEEHFGRVKVLHRWDDLLARLAPGNTL